MLRTSNYKFAILVVICLALMFENISASMSRPPRNNDVSNMAEALKYLQDLDSYYANVARPRFGKRASLLQILKERAAAQDDNDLIDWQNKYIPQR
ncbi:neuropeptide F isoform X2 [Condylostylus longicornis]|uniref:neuropeptide F isoform X2 n=1 Tax=Condylostylus longicornis TaxID=2530218 RepID=UPI00244DAE7C|nr:neuropeptide F isoform X2 [Condylostylus longicornis]